MSNLSWCMFLRINTHNTLMADTCVSLLNELGPSLIIKNAESEHYPGTFLSDHAPKFNSGDLVIVNDIAHQYQENPSKNRILRAFTKDPRDSDFIFKSFNNINMNVDSAGFYDSKPNFSKVINLRFVPAIDQTLTDPFVFISETKNPQVILYSGSTDSTPFNWLAIHDDYTFLLIATQMSVEEAQDLFMPHLPGAYVFCMAVSGKHLAVHPLFIAQKFRRLEKSIKEDGCAGMGKLRALSGVESYLDRLSIPESSPPNSEI